MIDFILKKIADKIYNHLLLKGVLSDLFIGEHKLLYLLTIPKLGKISFYVTSVRNDPYYLNNDQGLSKQLCFLLSNKVVVTTGKYAESLQEQSLSVDFEEFGKLNMGYWTADDNSELKQKLVEKGGFYTLDGFGNNRHSTVLPYGRAIALMLAFKRK